MGLTFRRCSRCSKGGCVEVARQLDGTIILRSNLHPDQMVTLTASEWADFVAAVVDGEFDNL